MFGLDPAFIAAAGTLWMIGFLRTQGTYWIGRGAEYGYRKTRKRREGPTYQRARTLVERWGAWAVFLCYLTVGLQTAVIMTAGVMRMPLLRFLLASLAGTFYWSIIYSTVGIAVIQAAVLAAAGSPWGIAALVLLALLIVMLVVRRRRRRTKGTTSKGTTSMAGVGVVEVAHHSEQDLQAGARKASSAEA